MKNFKLIIIIFISLFILNSCYKCSSNETVQNEAEEKFQDLTEEANEPALTEDAEKIIKENMDTPPEVEKEMETNNEEDAAEAESYDSSGHAPTHEMQSYGEDSSDDDETYEPPPEDNSSDPNEDYDYDSEDENL